MSVPWKPLLDGSDARRARETIESIIRTLVAPGPWTLVDPSFAAGNAGLAILFSEAARSGLMPECAAAAEEHLDRALAVLSEQPLPPSLFSGFTGIAWVARRIWGAGEDTDTFEEIDEALEACVAQPDWNGPYDLVHGLVGMGHDLAGRLDSPRARSCLERIVGHLDALAIPQSDGVAWKSPEGYFDAGVAHGIGGVIGLLAEAVAADVAAETSRRLLDGAVNWLLARRLPESDSSTFPFAVYPGQEPQPARLAWCYGDPGLAAALLGAARRVGNAAWEQEAVEVALRATTVNPARAGIFDAGICHGSAGVAHLYHRLYRATGEPRLAEAARTWFRWTLEFPSPEVGVAGFRAWRVQPDGTAAWHDDPGVLEGAAGVALCLISALSNVEPGWDAPFLLEIPKKTVTPQGVAALE